MTDAGFESFADSFRRERFGYAYDGDVGSFAPRPSGGLFDALLEGGDILCHNALRCSHSADSSRVARLVVNRVAHRTQSRMPAPIPVDPPTIRQIRFVSPSQPTRYSTSLLLGRGELMRKIKQASPGENVIDPKFF